VKVLVGDHSTVVRTRLVARLRECGLDVVGEADSLATASILASQLQPHAIVTDVKFADGQGVVVVRTIKLSAPSALLVVLTNTVHFRQACLANGADYFLDKSTEFDEVAPTLARPRNR
jgi:two-component system response regulator DevR